MDPDDLDDARDVPTRPRVAPKTPEQLQAEIAYFEMLKAQTRSRDRLKRADSAIRARVKQLDEARKVRS
jgi:hypothetical protein